MGTFKRKEARNAMSILEVKGVRKVYVPRFGGSQVEALKNVTF